MRRTSMRGRPLPALPMTNMKGRPLPALPDSKVLSPTHRNVDTDGKIEVDENCEEPNNVTYSQVPARQGAFRKTKMKECTTLYNGTEEQSPDTFGSHDDPTNENQRTEEEDINDPRQASQPSGQPTADLEDTDGMDRTSACLLDNPMYAAGVLQQDDRGIGQYQNYKTVRQRCQYAAAKRPPARAGTQLEQCTRTELACTYCENG
uniref:Uncharacterized protein n=1 Tax=Branchiostoma floridae TaxID=7739 RepID=C3YS50_BRAFL|eukprot:XP_002600943.1 hypothetical protein BRAFLDRAFT_79133 [Branchiostoma floridae]